MFDPKNPRNNEFYSKEESCVRCFPRVTCVFVLLSLVEANPNSFTFFRRRKIELSSFARPLDEIDRRVNQNAWAEVSAGRYRFSGYAQRIKIKVADDCQTPMGTLKYPEERPSKTNL